MKRMGIDGYLGPYTTAITADGKIVADFITAGHIDGGLITAGSITADAISAAQLLLAINGIASNIKLNENGVYLYNDTNETHEIARLSRKPLSSATPMLQFLSPLVNYEVGFELTDTQLLFRKGFQNNRVNGAVYGNESISMNGGSISTGGGSINTNNGNINAGNGTISTNGGFSYKGEEKDTGQLTVYLQASMSAPTPDGSFVTSYIKVRFEFKDGILTTWATGNNA